jgi:hypothetical protein
VVLNPRTQQALDQVVDGRTAGPLLFKINYCSMGGDSGGPVYASNTAYGIHQGGASLCGSVYQGIVAAQNGMNVDVILAP